MSTTVVVYVLYAREDEKFISPLIAHLRSPMSGGWLRVWYRGMIAPGADRQSEMRRHLADSDLVLLLRSPNQLPSCELNAVRFRYRYGLVQVIPIDLKPTLHDDEFSALQSLPGNDRWINSPCNHKLWLEVATGISARCRSQAEGQPNRLALTGMLDRMSKHQGKCMTENDDLATLADDEISALVQCLLLANLPEVRSLWGTHLEALHRDSDAPSESPFRSLIRQVLVLIGDMRVGIQNGIEVLDSIRLAIEGLNRFGARSAQLPQPDEVIFADFIIGLAYFETFVHLTAVLTESILGQPDADLLGRAYQAACSPCFSEGLSNAFDLHAHILLELNRTFYDDSESLWGSIQSALSGLDTGLLRAIKSAVSLRATPGQEQLPSTIPHPYRHVMAAAQILHWHGWGGRGEVFARLERYQDNPLLRTLFARRSHAFNWYGRDDSNIGSALPFKDEWKLHFRHAASELTTYMVRCSAALLTHPVLLAGRSPNESYICRLWGDAVGPLRSGERDLLDIVKAIQQRRSPGRRLEFKAVYTEISADCIRSLVADPYAFPGTRVIAFRDLNCVFPGERNHHQSGVTASGVLEANSFDCYTCCTAFHQIADLRSGHARIREILAFATRIVRPGGVISIPDASLGTWLQICLLPMNLVDREGGWSLDHGFSPEGFVRFSEIASTTDGQFIPLDEYNRFKIPLPLLSLRHATSRVLEERGNPMYEFTPCVVIDLSARDILALERRWLDAPTREERAAIGNEFLLRRWPQAPTLIDDVKSYIENPRCDPGAGTR